MTEAGPLLEVAGLSVRYAGRGRVLHDVSLAIPRGGALGLVGESGSGKSTVAGAILDLMGPGAVAEAGRISLDGRDLTTETAGRRRTLLGSRIGAVFQDPFTSLTPTMRVGRQIAEPLIRHRAASPAQARAAVDSLLAELGVDHPARVAASYPHELSGGLKQRALIAAAVICEPALIILDEPTTALDVTVEAQILAVLARLCASRGMAMLFISHNLAVIRRVCATVSVLYAGRVMEHGAAETVFGAPRHPYTRGLLASLPGRAARERPLSPIPGEAAGPATGPGCVFAPRCPYAEPGCTVAEPTLDDVGHGTSARCRRAAAIERQAWPEPAHADAVRQAPDGPVLLEAAGLRRSFAMRRPWSMLAAWFGQPARRLHAVDGIDLTLRQGEILGLVGESGSGKSTLGRLLLRLLPSDAGTVTFAGQDVGAMRARALKQWRLRAQMVFQNPGSSLNPRKTVRESIGRPLALAGASHARDVAGLLAQVQLAPSYAHRYPFQLSGGEKQRVSIARALATRPSFLVLDEPVSALDVSVQASILNLLLRLRQQEGLTYLFISHDLSVVAYMADRIAVMVAGAIVEIGPGQAVFARPRHPYTATLVAAMPAFDGARQPPAPPRRATPYRGEGCRYQERCPVKAGPVCETKPPPWRQAGADHRYACHHADADLQTGAQDA